MAALSKFKLRQILTNKLRLAAPQFVLEKVGPKLVGSIISSSFARKGDFQRQQMIWDALESELGAGAARSVGTLLAYTPDEWNVNSQVVAKG